MPQPAATPPRSGPGHWLSVLPPRGSVALAAAASSLAAPWGAEAEAGWQPKDSVELIREIGENGNVSSSGEYTGDKGDPNTWDTSLITDM